MPGAGGNGEFLATIMSMLGEMRQQTLHAKAEMEDMKAMLQEHEKNQEEFRSAHRETAKTLRVIQERLLAMEKRQVKADERMVKFDERFRQDKETDRVFLESLRHLTVFIQTVGKAVEGLKSRVDTIENR